MILNLKLFLKHLNKPKCFRFFLVAGKAVPATGRVVLVVGRVIYVASRVIPIDGRVVLITG
jgi:hypothetical protein